MNNPSDCNRAALTPCQECPWRVSNVDRPAPEPFEDSYTREHHLRCWRDFVNGGLSICHLTASSEDFPMGNDPAWIAGGYQAVPENARPRECAGSVAAALREVRTLVNAGSYEEYARRRPRGMTRATATLWVKRVQGAGSWPRLREPLISEAEIVDPGAFEDVDLLEVLKPEVVAALIETIDGLLDGARQDGA